MSIVVGDVAEAVYAILSTGTGGTYVKDLVGNRIYPGMLPDKVSAYPSLLYFVDSVRDDDTESAFSRGDTADTTIIRFISVGGLRGPTGYFKARQLAKAIKKQLQGLTTTVDNVVIGRIQRIGERDSFDFPTDTHGVTSEYSVFASYE